MLKRTFQLSKGKIFRRNVCRNYQAELASETRSAMLSRNNDKGGIRGVIPPSSKQYGPLKVYCDGNTNDVSEKVTWDEGLIPQYLQETYWWAYIHPNAIKFWERQWLVNSILWGNYRVLRDSAFDEMTSVLESHKKQNVNILQVACVYGDFTAMLSQRILKESSTQDSCQCHTLHVVDIAPQQLMNTRRKLAESSQDTNTNTNASDESSSLNVKLVQENSSCLGRKYSEKSLEMIYLFFLLHEQPLDVRIGTLNESIAALKDDGMSKLVIVDYHRPCHRWNPFVYIMQGILTWLEPFAMDLWHSEVTEWIDRDRFQQCDLHFHKNLYFGGLYQQIVLTKTPKQS